ncbi:MAG: hypothetical protein M1825_001506 [Sarcosagium campestre]|nr:MAG: hypothetical protein M1825_001506 [Sarcosagium campestre]
MSLSIPSAPNSGLFKQGYQNYESEDGAVLRNIDACRTIAQTVQTSLGPYGRNKIVINHLQKMILTSDAATILRELDVVHPAAKLIVMASQQQEAEVSNFLGRHLSGSPPDERDEDRVVGVAGLLLIWVLLDTLDG